MKKLLGIVVLGLLWCSFTTASEMNVRKKIKLPEDIMKGYKTSWTFSCTFTEDKNVCLTPDYAYKIVDKKNDFPVRLGDQSLRIELRKGDCHQRTPKSYNQCKSDPPAERHEFMETWGDKTVSTKNKWYFHSMYIPETKKIKSDWITMGQFHNLSSKPPINFDLNDKGDGRRVFELVSRFACQHPKKYKKKNVPCYSDDPDNRIVPLIEESEDLFGKWHDFIVNANWSSKPEKGYFKLWVNGKLAYHFKGRTVAPKNQIVIQFGIYRGMPTKGENGRHVVFYDEFRIANKSCKKLELKELGYSCSELEKQKIDNIHTIEYLNLTSDKSDPAMDGKYKLAWIWINKTMDDNEIERRYLTADEVTIKNGKIKFDKMGDSKDISNKYRKKISFINFGDKFVIQGNLDLDTSKPSPVAINGSSTKNEKGLYIGEGLFAIDGKKNKKEYIGIFLKPLN